MRTLVATAIVGIPIAAVLITLLFGWKLALATVVIDVAVVLAGLASRAWDRGNRQTARIFDEELGGEPDHKGLGPKDLAMDLRVDGDPTVYRTDDTEPGETR